MGAHGLIMSNICSPACLIYILPWSTLSSEQERLNDGNSAMDQSGAHDLGHGRLFDFLNLIC